MLIDYHINPIILKMHKYTKYIYRNDMTHWFFLSSVNKKYHRASDTVMNGYMFYTIFRFYFGFFKILNNKFLHFVTKCNMCEKSIKGRMLDHQICFGYLDGKQDSCEFDDGGPAVCDGELQGIFSWDNRPRTDIFGYSVLKCDENGVVGIFTSLCYFIDWSQTNKE